MIFYSSTLLFALFIFALPIASERLLGGFGQTRQCLKRAIATNARTAKATTADKTMTVLFEFLVHGKKDIFSKADAFMDRAWMACENSEGNARLKDCANLISMQSEALQARWKWPRKKITAFLSELKKHGAVKSYLVSRTVKSNSILIDFVFLATRQNASEKVNSRVGEAQKNATRDLEGCEKNNANLCKSQVDGEEILSLGTAGLAPKSRVKECENEPEPNGKTRSGNAKSSASKPIVALCFGSERLALALEGIMREEGDADLLSKVHAGENETVGEAWKGLENELPGRVSRCIYALLSSKFHDAQDPKSALAQPACGPPHEGAAEPKGGEH